MPMDPSQEFLKHATECKRLARIAHSHEDKAAWIRMAERWQRCAEWFDGQTLAAIHHPPTHYRNRPFSRWVHH
jgi:hypothetical protein